MRHIGDITLVGGGEIQNLRVENLAADPTTPFSGQIWYNTAMGVLRTYDGTTIKTLSTGGDSAAIQAELDATQVGAGLGADGSYTAPEDSNYLGSAVSLYSADSLLDSKLKDVSDAADAAATSATAAASKATAIATGAGLSAEGAYTADADSNYIQTATSLADADSKLDAQVKIATDAAGAAATAAEAAVQRAGDTMEGNLAFGGVHKITGLANGTLATDAINKGQLDAALAGLDFQADVWGVQVDDTLVPELIVGRRYILSNVADLATEFGTIADVGNGDIVEYDGTDFQVVYDVSVAGPGAIAWNRADSQFWYFNTSWTAFGGMSGVEAGVGIVKTGNVLSVAMGAGLSQLPTNEVGIDLFGGGAIFLTEDGTTDSTSTDAKLALRLDGASLSKSATGLKIADGGVTATQIAAAVAGAGLQGGAGTALSVKVKADGGILANQADGLSIDPSVLEFLPLEGGTLTGPLTLAADPVQELEAATKRYVDSVKEAVEGSTFVYDGSTSSATHSVPHNIGSRFCNVTVIDSANKVIIPDSIEFVDDNNLTVGFISAITCTVVVTGKYVAPQA